MQPVLFEWQSALEVFINSAASIIAAKVRNGAKIWKFWIRICLPTQLSALSACLSAPSQSNTCGRSTKDASAQESTVALYGHWQHCFWTGHVRLHAWGAGMQWGRGQQDHATWQGEVSRSCLPQKLLITGPYVQTCSAKWPSGAHPCCTFISDILYWFCFTQSILQHRICHLLNWLVGNSWMVAASCSTSLTLSWETSCDSHKVHLILTKIIKSIQWSWPWQITTITLRCYSYFNIMQYQYHICTQQYSWKRAWNNHSPRAENAQINPCKTCEGIERIPCKNLSQDSSQHFVRFVFLPSAAYSVLGAPEASIRHTLINFFGLAHQRLEVGMMMQHKFFQP